MSINFTTNPNKREFLFGLGATLGTTALNTLLGAEAANPLATRPAHHRSKAKRCVFIYLAGGPSHIDMFDPKPELSKRNGETFHNNDEFTSGMARGSRRLVGSPFQFRQYGETGISICDRFQHLPKFADDLCIYRGCQGESVNHPTANLHMNTGNRFGGEPAVGAWVSYGLGTESANLPSFVVLPGEYYPQAGAANWSNGYLPAHHQGTPLRSKGSPILDLFPPPGVPRSVERRNLDLLAEFEREHSARHPEHESLAARMHNYELMFRMQTEVPGVLDIDGESETTQSLYGINEKGSDSFGRRCLLARRLVEKGVRFVQIQSVGWDSHDDLRNAHTARIHSIDKPIAGLIHDLKQRDMLEETLIVCCGEFGRSPDNAAGRGKDGAGRDHNPKGMSVLFAGGGVNPGYVGATDEIGQSAIDVVHPIKDLHTTMLHLLGLDDNKLTYFHGGRYKQLSQTGGEVISEIVA
ncbi:MAG: DUF1501 domain-containing protein [Verrucomicrobiota bacterium]